MEEREKLKSFLRIGAAALILLALSGFIFGCSGGAFVDPGQEEYGSGGSDGGSSSTIPSELVGSWYSTLGNNARLFQFKSNGEFILYTGGGAPVMKATVRDNTVRLVFEGVSYGSFDYHFEGEELHVDGGTNSFYALMYTSPYVKY